MTLPVGIITATVNFGAMIDDAGNPFKGSVVFTSSRPKVWAATGTPIMPRALVVNLDRSGSGSIVLPATDQPGFTNGAGGSVTDWTYTATIKLAGRSDDRRTFALPTGGATGVTVDLDLMTTVPSSTGTTVATPAVLSVNGITGAVTPGDAGLERASFQLDGTAPTFTRLSSGSVFSVSTPGQTAVSIYWPWIVDARAMFGGGALDAFYMYYSTDHAVVGADGIYLATGPTVLGPWTPRGRVYRDTTSGNQTETPTVFADPTGATAAVMLYQQEGVSGAVGTQSTMYATSTNGITWTRGGIAIDVPVWWPSDGHTGYARYAKIGGTIFSHSLAGGTNYPLFGLSTSTDGRTWQLQSEPLHYALDLSGDGRRIEWNSGDVVLWRGQRWWIGFMSDFVSGSTPKNARIVVAPISADLRTLTGAPKVQLYPTVGAETTNYRSMRTFVQDGRLFMYYQCGGAFYVAEGV